MSNRNRIHTNENRDRFDRGRENRFKFWFRQDYDPQRFCAPAAPAEIGDNDCRRRQRRFVLSPRHFTATSGHRRREGATAA
jgi:hypothetical protein